MHYNYTTDQIVMYILYKMCFKYNIVLIKI